jgi:hypothetical protein
VLSLGLICLSSVVGTDKKLYRNMNFVFLRKVAAVPIELSVKKMLVVCD